MAGAGQPVATHPELPRMRWTITKGVYRSAFLPSAVAGRADEAGTLRSPQFKAKGGCTAGEPPPKSWMSNVWLEIVADADRDVLKGRMQADRCIVRRGSTGTRADSMQADVFRERAEISVPVLEPQRQIRSDKGLDAPAAGRVRVVLQDPPPTAEAHGLLQRPSISWAP